MQVSPADSLNRIIYQNFWIYFSLEVQLEQLIHEHLKTYSFPLELRIILAVLAKIIIFYHILIYLWQWEVHVIVRLVHHLVSRWCRRKPTELFSQVLQKQLGFETWNREILDQLC